ncbi:MAG: Fe-S cluster assembly protein SufD [Dongiaceae bacterium]
MSATAGYRGGKPPRRRREDGMPLDSRSIPLPYADRFEGVAPSLPGHELPWLRDLRAEAIERVRQSGLPTIRNERWKYTNLKSLAAIAFAPAGDAAAPIAPDHLPSITGACQIVFVDGRYRADLSTNALPSGLTIASFADLLRDDPDSLRTALAESATADGGLAALNLAFARDGYLIRLAPDAAVQEPVEIVHATTRTDAVAIHSRNHIVLGQNSSATIVESFIGEGASVYWSQPVTDIRVGPGATLRHYRDQNEGSKAYHTATTNVCVAAGGRYDSFLMTTGAALSRDEVAVTLDGSGASCRLDGSYLARARQHVDNTTEIVHAKPHTTSAEVYKGVLDDQARGVFQGRIVVAKDAQKSDGHQLNKTILLSDRAEIDTKPELEIYADDVKCSHGATAGELDEDALFYLRARGIDQADARRLLVEAFVGDAVENIADAAIRDAFARRIGQWMSAGAERAA